MARGLMWDHRKVVLGSDCFVDVLSLTSSGEVLFQRYAKMNAKDRVRDDIGEGALVYEGMQGTDNPQVSVWELSIYGGVKLTSADGTDPMSRFGVLTGPLAIKDRADERGARFLIAHALQSAPFLRAERDQALLGRDQAKVEITGGSWTPPPVQRVS
jgi:hypothetical protein